MQNFGETIGYFGGPRLSPYAQAIADSYHVQVPLFINVPTGLTGATDETSVVVVPPYQHDVLIFGAHVDACLDAEAQDLLVSEAGDQLISEAGDDLVSEGGSDVPGDCDGQKIFLQVNDQRSGLTWATASPLNGAPMSAYGGGKDHVMPVLKMPEAFFLPANTELRHEFKTYNNAATGGAITWSALQLINPHKGSAPREVTMPDGSTVRVGSRVPWLAVIGLGREQYTGGFVNYQLNANRRYVAYTQPAECDILVTDIHAQFYMDIEDLGGDPDGIQFSLSDTGERLLWNNSFTPARDFAGDTSKVFPALPLCMPYLLKQGRSLEVTMLNNVSGVAATDAFLVIRGYKLGGFGF